MQRTTQRPDLARDSSEARLLARHLIQGQRPDGGFRGGGAPLRLLQDNVRRLSQRLRAAHRGTAEFHCQCCHGCSCFPLSCDTPGASLLAPLASGIVAGLVIIKLGFPIWLAVLTGILTGTLIGLVQMLANMSDPASIGPAMAVALLTTLYGAIIANVFAQPLSDKLARASQLEKTNKSLILETISGIQEGMNPRVLEQMLASYLPSNKRAKDGDDGQ